MILVDTSVWVGHFRIADEILVDLLRRERVLMHPFVFGELVLGGIPGSGQTAIELNRLPQAVMARADEVLRAIASFSLAGSGIGYTDAHLVTAAKLTPGATLWSHDKRLEAVAGRLAIAAALRH